MDGPGSELSDSFRRCAGRDLSRAPSVATADGALAPRRVPCAVADSYAQPRRTAAAHRHVSSLKQKKQCGDACQTAAARNIRSRRVSSFANAEAREDGGQYVFADVGSSHQAQGKSCFTQLNRPEINRKILPDRVFKPY